MEELNETAEKYFASIDDISYLMRKPLGGFTEAPTLLQNVGLLFAGSKLSKSMTVLDFAAGTCWLSYYLNRLQCRMISCDVSQTALDIGKRYFELYKLPNPPLADPEFLRVLKDGGIVGFSEPGRMHSQTAQSQHEMMHYTVLENDMRLNDIYEIA